MNIKYVIMRLRELFSKTSSKIDESENDFEECFCYAVTEDNEGFYVTLQDLDNNEHEICYTKSEKVADYLQKHFDNLAIDEERELFEGLIN